MVKVQNAWTFELDIRPRDEKWQEIPYEQLETKRLYSV
jgi:hypothetical protein